MYYHTIKISTHDLKRTSLFVREQQRRESKTNNRSECRHSGRQGLKHVNENTLMLTVWDGIRFSLL